MRTNVLLVDGRKVTREGIAALLERHADLAVVGEADDGAAAAKLAKALSAHVAVMLVGNYTGEVGERIRGLAGAAGGPRVIVLLMHLDGAVLRRALEAGAAGCLSKECASAELVAAIRAVRSGKTYLSPRATDEVVNRYVLGRMREGPRGAAALSGREREVLRRIADGASTREIAGELRIGVKTVETYRRRLMEKLNVRSVAGLTKYAVQNGISALGETGRVLGGLPS